MHIVLNHKLVIYCLSTAENDIKLVAGKDSREGRIEVYLQGQWGTICDDLWDIREATVVCKEKGFLDAKSAESGGVFPQGNGPIQLDDVRCVGNETALTDCPAKPIQQHNCNHTKDAGVRCNICNEPPCQLGGITTYLCGHSKGARIPLCSRKQIIKYITN